MIGKELPVNLRGILRSTIGMVHAAFRRLARPDGSFERGDREPGVDRAADRIAHHATRPGVENRRQIDEAGRDRDIGDIRHPQLIRTVDDQIAGAIGKDRAVMIAIGRGHVAAPALRQQVALAHQPPNLLMIDDDALMPEFGADTPITVSLELIADRPYAVDDLGVVEMRGRRVVEGRSGQAHQPTSLRDGETAGPETTDVVSLLGRGAFFSALFRNSISRACRPTMRSSAAILASYSCSRSAAWTSSSRAPASYLPTQMRIS